MSDFDILDEEVRSCTLCTLSAKRTNAVPGDGDRKANVMFIGEGPGYYEDQQGIPFVGRAGQLLNEMLESIDLRRQDIYITNMLKCRPPNNRDPLPAEITACGPYLERQIRMISPKVIVTLGRYSTANFFPTEPISKLRGKPMPWNGITILPMYHPAAALRNGKLKDALHRDFQQIPELLDPDESADRSDPPLNTPSTATEERQLDMFTPHPTEKDSTPNSNENPSPADSGPKQMSFL